MDFITAIRNKNSFVRGSINRCGLRKHFTILFLTALCYLLTSSLYCQWLETTIPVDTNPRAMIWNSTNNKVYCIHEGSCNITVIDAAANRVMTKIDIRDIPYALVYNPIGNKIYCANISGVSVIDGTTDSVMTT
ncbi:MAG: hypothetical protein OEW70_09165, partial [candidate division WOR-3 bacterium]|nr:hypothetical protein [candidate division WOR-3 bacterium]